MISMGHKYALVMASYVKWVLRGELPPEWRLEFLAHLEKMTDGTLTPAVIAMVEPMDADGRQIYEEASKLGYGIVWDSVSATRRPNMFDVLYQKFDVFVALNPSLERAYNEACRPWGGSYQRRPVAV